MYYHNSLKFIREDGSYLYHRFIQQYKRCPVAGHPVRVLKICVCALVYATFCVPTRIVKPDISDIVGTHEGGGGMIKNSR